MGTKGRFVDLLAPRLAEGYAVSELLRQALNAAVLRIFRVVARLLLKAHMGVGDAYALLKLAYVLEAKGSHGVRSRANIARISTASGLTRQEVTSILDLAPGEIPAVHRGQARDEAVLAGWRTDKAFLNPRTGKPARLTLREGPASFAWLVKKYSGDSQESAVLDALVAAKAACVLDDGTVQAMSSTCANVDWEIESIASLGEELELHGEALVHNLSHPENPRYVRCIRRALVDVDDARVILPEIQESADDLLDSATVTFDQAKSVARGKKRKLAISLLVQIARESVDPSEEERQAPLRTSSGDRGKRRVRLRHKQSAV